MAVLLLLLPLLLLVEGVEGDGRGLPWLSSIADQGGDGGRGWCNGRGDDCGCAVVAAVAAAADAAVSGGGGG